MKMITFFYINMNANVNDNRSTEHNQIYIFLIYFIIYIHIYIIYFLHIFNTFVIFLKILYMSEKKNILFRIY